MNIISLSDQDVSQYLATLQDDEIIEKCLLEQAFLWKHGRPAWGSATAFYTDNWPIEPALPYTSKQQEQLFLYDTLARSQPVTKAAFLQAWKVSWCANILEWG